MDTIVNYVTDFYNFMRNALSAKTLGSSGEVLITRCGFYIVLYLTFCYVIYVVSTIFRNNLGKSKHFERVAKRLLLVTAHPDDECMFFGPLIIGLQRQEGCAIYVLCLSKGDAEKKGHLRKRELYDSCQVLGVSSENVFLCSSVLRMDGPQYKWKSENIAALIQDYVESYEIDTVVTFDKYGVSGHENHIALFRAVSYLCLRNWLPQYCRVFVLDSIGKLRKYSSLMDSVWSLVGSDNVFVLSPYEQQRVKRAMKMHSSQLVWFRRIYINVSRYMFINTFSELARFQVDYLINNNNC